MKMNEDEEKNRESSTRVQAAKRENVAKRAT